MINAKVPVVMICVFQYLDTPEFAGCTMFIYECLYRPGKYRKQPNNYAIAINSQH